MGLFESIFKKQKAEQAVEGYFKTLTGYTPSFTSYEGSLYEMELTRAAIHAFASQAAKLRPEVQGSKYKNLNSVLQLRPNQFMDAYKYIYRLATILECDNNAFITPIYGQDMQTITGLYPVVPQAAEIVQAGGVPYLRYKFSTGQTAAIELENVGILTKFQYKNDFFGESNRALNSTMQLIHTQNEGIIEGITQSATIRFIAKLAQSLRPEDIERERKRFASDNLSSKNNGGVMLVDTKYSDVKQIDSSAVIVNAAQKAAIEDNVYTYFGTPKEIIQNKADESTRLAWYEGKLEPFAVQLSLVTSNMLFTKHEQAFGNGVVYGGNRLQYANDSTKLSIFTQMRDRGAMSADEGREMFSLPPLPDGSGKAFHIRKEYTEVNNVGDDPDKTSEKDEEAIT